MVRSFDEQMNTEIDMHVEKQLQIFDSNRLSFQSRLVDKMNAINDCLREQNVTNMLFLDKADNLALLEFLYYIDHLFFAPPSVNLAHYITEAFSMADDSQSRLNEHLNGVQYIYEMDVLRTRIAHILSQDDTQVMKQDIINMYDADIRSIIIRFRNETR